MPSGPSVVKALLSSPTEAEDGEIDIAWCRLVRAVFTPPVIIEMLKLGGIPPQTCKTVLILQILRRG
jgi:hypothetical protein